MTEPARLNLWEAGLSAFVVSLCGLVVIAFLVWVTVLPVLGLLWIMGVL